MPIVSGHWDELKQYLVPLRTHVFIDEQQVPPELEWDEEDATAVHFVVFEAPASALGCARLLPTGQIGRMAVVSSRRGSGFGQALLQAAENSAISQGLHEVFLHAQTHAIPFYSRFGYRISSDEFMDAGIPHRTMYKLLKR